MLERTAAALTGDGANGEVHVDVLEIQQDCKEETAGQKISLRVI